MEKIFIPIYRFFKKHRAVMWTLMIASFVIFAFFGFQLKYEENILKLLPQTESSTNGAIAFGNLKVKDKIFIQIVHKGFTAKEAQAEANAQAASNSQAASDTHVEEADTQAAEPDMENFREGTENCSEDLCMYCDELMDSILVSDAAQKIANVLYRVDDDLMINGLDYATANLPTFIDESCYTKFDSLLTADNIRAQMAANAEILENDADGNLSMMVAYDPAGLRKGMMSQGMELKSGLSGYSIHNGHFISGDGKAVIAYISPDFSSMDSKAGVDLVQKIERQTRIFKQNHPDVDVYIHGSPVMSANNSRRIKEDLALTVGLSLIIICFLIALCFKNKNSLLFLLLPVVYGTVFALACVYWIKGSMSLMAIGIGAVVLGVALSYCLHIVTHYKYVSDPEQVLRDQATPVSLGCITTVGAFLGLLFTSSELLRDFGIFASFAMIGTTLFSLIFLPQFFSADKNKKSEKAFTALQKINSYPYDRNRWILGTVIAITLVCICLPAPKFDKELSHINYFAPEVKEALALYNTENNKGYTSQYYASQHDDLDSALIYNRAIFKVLDSLKAEGVVKQYSHAGDLFIPSGEQQRRIDLWKEYWNGTPAEKAEQNGIKDGKPYGIKDGKPSLSRLENARRNITAAAKEYGLNPTFFEPFYTLCETDYTPESIYNSGIIPEEMLCNFIEKTGDGPYIVLTSALMEPDNKQKVNDAVNRQPHALVIDPFYYTGDMVEIIHDDFSTILAISMIFVFIVLICSFRCLGISIVAFLPMTLGWFIVQGTMYVFGLQFNLINIIIASFIFGIGVDYSIFVMQGLLADATGGDTKLLTYHKTAIFLSALILITVTGSLLFAKHPAIKSIGISAVVGMGASIVLAYTLEPFLFRLLMKIPYYRRRYSKK